MKRHLSADECAKRYPRLLRAMKWAACLSETEASATLRDLRNGNARYGGGEAVSHFGGPLAVLQAAKRCRHNTRIDMTRLRRLAKACARTWERGATAYHDCDVFDADGQLIGRIGDTERHAFQRALTDAGKVSQGYDYPDITTGCTHFYA